MSAYSFFVLVQAKVTGIDSTQPVSGRGCVSAVRVTTESAPAHEHRISCSTFVNATGPAIAAVDRLLPWDESSGVAIEKRVPIVNEVHAKVIFRDTLGVVPRDAPMLIWDDEQLLNYTEEEREILPTCIDPETAEKILAMAPKGVHLRPYAYDSLLLLWEYWNSDTHSKLLLYLSWHFNI